jgi:hypothetical protein
MPGTPRATQTTRDQAGVEAGSMIVNSIGKAYNRGCRGHFPAEVMATGDSALGDRFAKSHNLWRLL